MSGRALALITAALTAFLMVLGGVVHATESSLACPDWPTCHGQWMPEMVGGVLYEHSHRIVGTLVGVFTLALAAALWRKGGMARAAGLGAIAIVIAQGILGGLTVILELPPPVSTAHLATAFTFLALLLWVSRLETPKLEVDESVCAWTGMAAMLVWAQSVVGALVRHSGAGAACGDDPFRCAGQWWPAWELGRLQIFHRGVAIAVAVAVVGVAIVVFRSSASARLRPFAVGAVSIVAAQIGLGLWSVTSALDATVVTLHLAGGIALFATLLWMRLSVLDRELARRARAGETAEGKAQSVPA